MRPLDELTDKRATIALTVNHTGTNFLLEFLASLPGIPGWVEITEWLDGGVDLPERAVVHVHLYGERLVSRRPVREFLPAELIDHVATNRLALCSSMRDPLAAIASRERRSPGFAHAFIPRAIAYLARFHEHIHWLAVDVQLNRRGRLATLARAVTDEIADGVIDSYVSWPVVREAAGKITSVVERPEDVERRAAVLAEGYPLKDAAARGDVAMIAAACPVAYGELIGLAPVIVPFLQQLGYARQSWWP